MHTVSQHSRVLFLLPAWLMVTAISIPVVSTLLAVAEPPGPIWEHLQETVLHEYVLNSLALMALTGAVSLVLGVGTGWLIGACAFKGRETLSWLLMLPLAAPAYIVAYVYTDLLEVSGPVLTALRSLLSLDVGELPLPSIRTLPGAAILLSLVLYPYIYLLSRNSFAGRSGAQFDAARVLGHGPYSAFFRIALPASRPAILGGLALVLMETLADFGVVSYFSVPTFSTGIFRTWLGLGDAAAALKLAAFMLLFVIMLVALEERNRRGTADSSDLTQASRINLTGAKAGLAIAACLVPVMLGFAIPLTTLLIYASEHLSQNNSANFGRMAINSVSLALTASVAITLIAWLLAYTKRMYPSPLNNSLIRVSTIGYALPGILLAVALLKSLGAVNHWLVDIWPNSKNSIFTGGVFLLLYAYVCRFLTVAYQSLESGFTSISADLDAAARTLGATTLGLTWRIHLPLLKPSILGAFLLVFVDVMRELPATLILRPFNFNTLATHVYRLASDERLSEASLAALLIVMVGVIPVVLLQRSGSSRATLRT